MALRTFLALDIDPLVRQRLAEVPRRLGGIDDDLRWVAPHNLHVTIRFLGDVGDELLADVCSLVGHAVAPCEPFDFRVRGVTCMPPGGRVRMVGAEADEPSGRLLAMVQAVDAALEHLPLRHEKRAFRPHLTLARARYLGQWQRLRQQAATMHDEDFGLVEVDELVAYTSNLTPEGPIYTPIARFPIG